MAYYNTYNLPVTLSNCSNNYGPYQFPEKLIPLMIFNMLNNKPLPVYGDGKNVRDWLYVTDHAQAIWLILNKGSTGETYNLGRENEIENIRLVEMLCVKMAGLLNHPADYFKPLISFVKDRPGHDRRYAINCDKIKRELGWKPATDFTTGLEMTTQWYIDHRDWVENINTGAYRKWIRTNYGAS